MLKHKWECPEIYMMTSEMVTVVHTIFFFFWKVILLTKMHKGNATHFINNGFDRGIIGLDNISMYIFQKKIAECNKDTPKLTQ